MSETQQRITALARKADVFLNGNRPSDPQIKDPRFYNRILADGTLGLGESYMDEWWECEEIDQFITKVLSAHLYEEVGTWKLVMDVLKAKIINAQAKRHAFNIGEKHYDVGNYLYEKMLDKRMVYTCGYWENAQNLDEAQEAKLDLVCRKIGLKEGQRVLDIGCGWGSFAKYAAEKYGASVVGVTVSKEQVELGRKNCEGLPVEIRLQDYRELNEKFDHVISLGMFEHVGYKNYPTYMQVVSRCLKEKGLFLLHTIGSNASRVKTDKWIDKYIFPNSMLPSIAQIGKSIEGLFVMEDWHNLSIDYDKTLMAWHANFSAHKEELKREYGERFMRMWKYYLLSCAGTFRSRNIQIWQIVLSRKGVGGGYTSLR